MVRRGIETTGAGRAGAFTPATLRQSGGVSAPTRDRLAPVFFPRDREQTLFRASLVRRRPMPTPYRDDTDSLDARHAALSEELSSVQAKTKELDELKATEARLAREVADIAKKLEERSSRRALPLLESIQIATPCTASWDEMIGDDRARFCTHCQKDVFNLSAMPRDEAESFMQARTAEVCVRLYRRTDGTVLTSDCPVGVKRKRRRKAVVAAVGSSLLAAGAMLMASARTTREPEVMKGAMPVAPMVPTVGSTSVVPEMGAPPPRPSVEVRPRPPMMGGVRVPPWPRPHVTPPKPKATTSGKPASPGDGR